MSFQVSFKSLVCTSNLANTTWCNIGWPPSVPCHLQPFKPELPTETQQHQIENTKYQATASEPSSPLRYKDGGAWIENNKNRSQAWNVSSINTNLPIFKYLSYSIHSYTAYLGACWWCYMSTNIFAFISNRKDISTTWNSTKMNWTFKNVEELGHGILRHVQLRNILRQRFFLERAGPWLPYLMDWALLGIRTLNVSGSMHLRCWKKMWKWWLEMSSFQNLLKWVGMYYIYIRTCIGLV